MAMNYEVRFTNSDGSCTDSVLVENATLNEAMGEAVACFNDEFWWGPAKGVQVIPETDEDFMFGIDDMD